MCSNLCVCDINQDKSECANQLVGLATCLPYVGGEAKAPTQDCCTGLKQVLKNSKKCLCILVKDRNDPSLGLKVNATLALGLPQNCHVPSKDNISECPGMPLFLAHILYLHHIYLYIGFVFHVFLLCFSFYSHFGVYRLHIIKPTENPPNIVLLGAN